MRKQTTFFLTLLLIALLISGCAGTGEQQIVTPDLVPTDTEVPRAKPIDTMPPPSPTTTATLSVPPTEVPPPNMESGPAPTLTAGVSLDIYFIQMLDRKVGWAIGGVDGSRDRILHTQDGAVSFQDVTPPVGPALSSGTEKWAVGAFIDPNQARVLYFPAILEPLPPGGADVIIWRTEDAGTTWSQSSMISTSVLGTQDFPPRLFFINPDEGWFMARNGGAGMHRYPISLYRTRDGGASWEALIEAIGGTGLQSCRKTGWAFGDVSNGIATIDNCPVDGPAIERTHDGGRTWERVILSPPQEDPQTVTDAYCQTEAPRFVDGELLVLSASCTAYEDPQIERQLFYRSSDGGQTWDAWDYPGGQLLFLDETRGFALSREIFWTADSGVTWERRKRVNWDGQFSFVDPEAGWAVARADEEIALVTTEDGGDTWQIIDAMLAP
jgi:photosystem II stability/assembly factor-like uncharacterized protein